MWLLGIRSFWHFKVHRLLIICWLEVIKQRQHTRCFQIQVDASKNRTHWTTKRSHRSHSQQLLRTSIWLTDDRRQLEVTKQRTNGVLLLVGAINDFTVSQTVSLINLSWNVLSFFCFRFKALYKGIVPKILRLGPGGAIMLLVNEYVFEYLCQRFPN